MGTKIQSLLPYQQTGKEILIQLKKTLFADDPGLGKTRQAIEAVKDLSKIISNLNVLIICPAALRIHWEDEFFLWGAEAIPKTIVSYNFIQKLENCRQLITKNPILVIADEAHNLKNWAAKQTRNFALEIISKCRPKYLWLITATPVGRSNSDYHPLLSVLQPGKWGKYSTFCSKYCLYDKDTRRYFGFKNSAELKKLVEPILLRRTKEQVAPQLPKKIFQKIRVEIDGISGQFFGEVTEDSQGEISLSDVELIKMKAIGLSKVDSIIEVLYGITTPTLIMVWHREVAELLDKKIKEMSKKSGVLYGGMTDKKRHLVTSAFEDGRIDFLICNTQVGGVGLNFPRADTLIYGEQVWSSVLRQQAEDRPHRINSKHESIRYIDIIVKDSLDEKINEVVKRKIKEMRKVIG